MPFLAQLLVFDNTISLFGFYVNLFSNMIFMSASKIKFSLIPQKDVLLIKVLEIE